MSTDTFQAIMFGGFISILLLFLNVVVVLGFMSITSDPKFIGIPAHIYTYTIFLGFALVAIGMDMALVFIAYDFFTHGKAP